MPIENYECYCAGESIDGSLSTSKACLERFMRAVLMTRSKVTGTFTFAPEVTNSWWVASVEIPAGKEDEFKKIAKCSLKRHANIQVGLNTIKSVKSVKYFTEDTEESLTQPDSVGGRE